MIARWSTHCTLAARIFPRDNFEGHDLSREEISGGVPSFEDPWAWRCSPERRRPVPDAGPCLILETMPVPLSVDIVPYALDDRLCRIHDSRQVAKPG